MNRVGNLRNTSLLLLASLMIALLLASCGGATPATTAPTGGAPEAIVIATGSEVALAATAVNALNAAGRRVRLVSMPSTDTFDAQDASYREAVLPAGVTRRVAIEAGSTALWWKYVGSAGRVLGIDTFGASAPCGIV